MAISPSGEKPFLFRCRACYFKATRKSQASGWTQEVGGEGEQLGGPFHLYLRAEGRHIRFDIRDSGDTELAQFYMALGPLRRVMRDYFQVCDTYYEAIRTKSPSQIQAIDMGRRALHNEGAEILRGRLDGKVATDEMTSRRLFTLICVLQTK